MNKKNNRISNHTTIFVKRNDRASRRRWQASKEKTRDRKTRKRRRKCFGGSSRKRIWAVESENGKWVTRTRRSRASEMTTSPTTAMSSRVALFNVFPRILRGESFHLASVTRRKFSARDFISNGLVVSCLFALLVEKLGPISVPRSQPPLKSRYAG